MGPLETALQNYLTLAHSVFSRTEDASHSPSTVKALPTSEDDQLRSTVNALEQQPEFGALVRRTAAEFSKDEFEKNIGNVWEWHVGNFLRTSGWYIKAWAGGTVESVQEMYRKAFEARELTVNYLAPLEYVEFTEDKMDFVQFEVRRFCAQEIDEIFNNRMLRVFFPQSHIDSAELADYWIVACSERKPISVLDFEDEPFGFQIQFESSRFPTPLARALRSLMLYPWHLVDGSPEPIHIAGKRQIDAGPVLFHVPFVLSTSDSLIKPPPSAPDFSVFSRDPYFDPETGEETGWQRPRGAALNEVKTRTFQDFVREMVASLDEVVDQGPEKWAFVGTSFDFLLKASFSEGLERLLWYITALDALLGGERSSSRVLKRRIGLLLGSTENERKNVEAKFDELYKIRNELVHGNTKLRQRQVFLGHLGEAREMARRTAMWMLRYLRYVRNSMACPPKDLPSREDLLAVLDMDERTRHRVSAILPCLPKSFPNPACWTK